MGLWKFVKGAGQSIFGGKDKEPNANDVEKLVDQLGLNYDGLEFAVKGDKVEIKGEAPSQEMKEKIIMAVGNVEGIAEVEEDAGGNDPVFHTVEKGDTLWAIASKTLGNGAKYEKIFEANKPMLSHPDKIYPGQVLIIPQD